MSLVFGTTSSMSHTLVLWFHKGGLVRSFNIERARVGEESVTAVFLEQALRLVLGEHGFLVIALGLLFGANLALFRFQD